MKQIKKPIAFVISLLGISLIMSATSSIAKDRVKQPNDVVISTMPEVDERELKCLADNIYYESRGEPSTGKIAVAGVTMNRVASSKFPTNVCSVVYQRTRKTCQFSWTCYRKKAPNPTVYKESLEIAEKVLTEEIDHSNIIGDTVMWYHADYVNPNWYNLRRVTKIGKHIFYRDRR